MKLSLIFLCLLSMGGMVRSCADAPEDTPEEEVNYTPGETPEAVVFCNEETPAVRIETATQYGVMKVETNGSSVNLEKYFTLSADDASLSVKSILSTVSKKPEIVYYGQTYDLSDIPDIYPENLTWSEKVAVINGGGYYMRVWVYDPYTKSDKEYCVKTIITKATSGALTLQYQMLVKSYSDINPDKYFTFTVHGNYLTVESPYNAVINKPEMTYYGQFDNLVDMPNEIPAELTWSKTVAIQKGGGYYLTAGVYNADYKCMDKYFVKMIINEMQTSELTRTVILTYQLFILADKS